METVGVYLKKERETKNISLREASRLTKISKRYLEYIEKNEFGKLPQGPYIKGYIASYSDLIGSNVDEALKLYDSLNGKSDQTEKIPSEISRNKHVNHNTLSAKANRKENPTGPLFGKVRSSFNSVASPSESKSASLNTEVSSIKNTHASIQRKSNLLENIVSIFKKIALSRTWLYAFIFLVGTSILILAGFGFYHLFFYDHHPLPVAQLQNMQDEETRPSSAVGPEKSTDESKPAKQTSPTLSDSPSPADNAASIQASDGKESRVSLDQIQMAGDSSPGSETAAVYPKVLKASVCSEIKNRMPAGVDTFFSTFIQQVYVWNEIEAKQVPSKIRHIYYFKGRIINDVTLDVRSTYWRTWSSKSISDSRYRGEWRVDIASADGKVLKSLFFEVE